MKRDFFFVLGLCLCITTVLWAQNPPNVGPNDSFAWNQDATSLSAAQGFVYKYYLDGAVTGSVWTTTCTGTTAPFTCQAKTPAFSQGQHSLTITAANTTGESGQSVPFVFVFGNPPNIPNNIRIIKG